MDRNLVQQSGWPATGVSSSGLASDVNPPTAARRHHILFLIDQLCEAGGAERVLLNMIHLLPKDQFRCSLATFKIDWSVEVFRQIACPVYVCPLQRTYTWHGLMTALTLRQLIRSKGVNIVHTFHESSDIWGGLIAKLSGCPVLISSRRDMGILRSPKHSVGYRAIRPFVDQFLTVSEEVRRFCIQQDRLDPGKVLTVYNGIELDKIDAATASDELRQKLGLVEASHLIVSVGHIRKVKGFDTFVRTAELVRREFPRALFLVVGNVLERGYFRELQSLIAEQGSAANVRFLGASDDVFSLLKVSNVFCLLSRSEGFSNAILEAMACGLPCVATRVGGNAEAIEDNLSGFLVPPEDPELAADRILTLLRGPEIAKSMGRTARKTIEERFTAQAMMRQLVGVYDRLLGVSSEAASPMPIVRHTQMLHDPD